VRLEHAPGQQRVVGVDCPAQPDGGVDPGGRLAVVRGIAGLHVHGCRWQRGSRVGGLKDDAEVNGFGGCGAVAQKETGSLQWNGGAAGSPAATWQARVPASLYHGFRI
jgi:hypothetical protein